MLRDNLGESTLSLPNLDHFELLKILLRKAAALENGNMFSDSPVSGGEKNECLSKVITEVSESSA